MKSKKKIFLFAICVLLSFFSFAQKNTISLHYTNLGKGGNRGWNSGIGTQLKIHLKNNWYILPDAGYLFVKINTPYYKDDKNFKKESHQYLFGNVNVGPSLSLSHNLKIVPYVGTGYYQDFKKMLMVSSGSGGGYRDPAMGSNYGYGPYHVLDKYSDIVIMLNLGFLAEYYITKHIFLTGGCKYMLDIYDKSGYFPYWNLGAGYRF